MNKIDNLSQKPFSPVNSIEKSSSIAMAIVALQVAIAGGCARATERPLTPMPPAPNYVYTPSNPCPDETYEFMMPPGDTFPLPLYSQFLPPGLQPVPVQGGYCRKKGIALPFFDYKPEPQPQIKTAEETKKENKVDISKTAIAEAEAAFDKAGNDPKELDALMQKIVNDPSPSVATLIVGKKAADRLEDILRKNISVSSNLNYKKSNCRVKSLCQYRRRSDGELEEIGNNVCDYDFDLSIELRNRNTDFDVTLEWDWEYAQLQRLGQSVFSTYTTAKNWSASATLKAAETGKLSNSVKASEDNGLFCESGRMLPGNSTNSKPRITGVHTANSIKVGRALAEAQKNALKNLRGALLSVNHEFHQYKNRCTVGEEYRAFQCRDRATQACDFMPLKPTEEAVQKIENAGCSKMSIGNWENEFCCTFSTSTVSTQPLKDNEKKKNTPPDDNPYE